MGGEKLRTRCLIAPLSSSTSLLAGASLTFVALITGQLLFAALADDMGLLGVELRPLTPLRGCGLAVTALGAISVNAVGGMKTLQVCSISPSRSAQQQQQQDVPEDNTQALTRVTPQPSEVEDRKAQRTE